MAVINETELRVPISQRAVHRVELVSDVGFPVPTPLLGQHFRILASLKLEAEGNARTIVGANLPSRTGQLSTVDCNRDGGLRYEHASRLFPDAVFISSYLHRDADALARLAASLQGRQQLVVVLHVTSKEYLDASKPSSARVRSWFASDASVSQRVHYVCVSEGVRRSFAWLAAQTPLEVILNGIDHLHYRPPTVDGRMDARSALGIHMDATVHLINTRLIPVKGSVAVLELLRRASSTRRTDGEVFVLALPLDRRSERWRRLIHDDLAIRSLLDQGALKIVCDFSKLVRDSRALGLDVGAYASSASSCDALSDDAAVPWVQPFVAHPIYAVADSYIRLSPVEAFSRGTVEALMCGNSVISEATGFVGEVGTLPETFHRVDVDGRDPSRLADEALSIARAACLTKRDDRVGIEWAASFVPTEEAMVYQYHELTDHLRSE